MTSMVEDLDLPFDYNENNRGGTLTFVGLCVATSAVMAAVTFFGFYAIPWWVVAIPVAVVIHRAYNFSMFRNAVHEAIRDADMDRRLDRIIEERAAAQQSERRILNAEVFAKKLIEEKAA